MGWERDLEGHFNLVWTQDRETRDMEEGTDVDTARERTMRLLGDMASSLIPGIKFIEDLSSRYPGRKVPMLDLQVWTESKGLGTQIRHTYYEKTVTSPLVFHSRGACPTKQKIIILAEETKRHLYNQDRSTQLKTGLRT